MKRWAIKWRQKNKLGGVKEHFIADGCNYLLFRTSREAKWHIRKEFGYIAGRKDLRTEPHGWRMPIAVRVDVKLTELKRTKG